MFIYVWTVANNTFIQNRDYNNISRKEAEHIVAVLYQTCIKFQLYKIVNWLNKIYKKLK